MDERGGIMRIKDFQSLVPRLQAAINLQVHEALVVVAEKIAQDARDKIGHDQAGWAPLADSTDVSKAAKGQPADSPLLARGDLKKSIEVIVEGHTAVIGTNDEAAVYQEMGTSAIPARPFLSRAAMENVEFAEREFAAALRKAYKL